MNYSVRMGFASLWRERWVNLLSVLSIAAGLLLIAIAVVVVHNIQLATRKLPDRFTVTVFLNPKLTGAESSLIGDRVREMPGVKSVKYISKEDALAELKDALRDPDFVLSGVDDNPLPASLEIRLNPDSVNDSAVTRLAGDIRALEGVTDVQYVSSFLETIQTVRRHADTAGLGVIILVGTAVIFVTYATVKILLYRKISEIEALKLLGATRSFIRTPYLIEGSVVGLAGGCLAAGLMALIVIGVLQRLAPKLPLIGLVSVPWEVALSLPLGGLVAGLFGALIAIGRIRF